MAETMQQAEHRGPGPKPLWLCYLPPRGLTDPVRGFFTPRPIRCPLRLQAMANLMSVSSSSTYCMTGRQYSKQAALVMSSLAVVVLTSLQTVM
jgi:hypothetical protein